MQEIIESSPALSKITRKYSGINDKRVSSYITKNEKKQLERKIAEEIHRELEDKDKNQYSVDRLIVIMPKLNLGPWIQHGNGGDSQDYGNVSSFISRNREVFEGYENLLERILERHYLERLQSAKNIEQARKILSELKQENLPERSSQSNL